MKKISHFFILFFILIFSYGYLFSQQISVEKTDNKVVLKNKIYFELSKSELTRKANDTLDEIASLLRLYPANVLVIEGHADNTGEKKYNKTLSDDRAQSVYDFLAERGVERYRMKIVHYGDQKPAKDNLTESGRAENRRAEIIIFQGE